MGLQDFTESGTKMNSRDSTKYFLVLLSIFLSYPILITIGYNCPEQDELRFGNTIIGLAEPFINIINSFAPIVETYSRRMSESGYDCNIELMQHIYAYDFMLIVVFLFIIIVFRKMIFAQFRVNINNIQSVLQRDHQKILHLANFFLFFLIMCLFVYLNDSLDVERNIIISSKMHVNKWYVLFDPFISSLIIYTSSATAALFYQYISIRKAQC